MTVIFWVNIVLGILTGIVSGVVALILIRVLPVIATAIGLGNWNYYLFVAALWTTRSGLAALMVVALQFVLLPLIVTIIFRLLFLPAGFADADGNSLGLLLGMVFAYVSFEYCWNIYNAAYQAAQRARS